jgi:glutamyl-tRNA(Gln) amidotransferase subunit D
LDDWKVISETLSRFILYTITTFLKFTFHDLTIYFQTFFILLYLTRNIDLDSHESSDKSYSRNSQKFLNKFKVSIGDEVKIVTNNAEFFGIILPRYETFSDKYIVLKLKSGYNIGIEIENIIEIINKNKNIDQLSKKPVAKSDPSDNVRANDDNNSHNLFDKMNSSKLLPKILLISTGGTIASKIDYRTGGVTSLLTASELYSAFPELSDYGYIYPEFLFNEYSENMNPHHWSALADRISFAINNEHYDGIIVSHGTDTMHYTSSALSFALQNIPIPVLLVGSQRSSDRPSSDAFSNLVGAIRFIKDARYSGIFVCMHHNTSDEVIACHLGTRVRKNHTSKRDAFKSLNGMPFALIENSDIKYNKLLHNGRIERANISKNFTSRTAFSDKVFLLKFYPGLSSSFLENFLQMDYKVIILEGTGLGHVSKDCFPILKKLIDSGIFVFMTSQCIFGTVQMTVYDTGRDLLGLGIISLSNMSSETAVVKAMWALGNNTGAEDFVRIMKTDYSNEISNMLPLV